MIQLDVKAPQSNNGPIGPVNVTAISETDPADATIQVNVRPVKVTIIDKPVSMAINTTCVMTVTVVDAVTGPAGRSFKRSSLNREFGRSGAPSPARYECRKSQPR